MADKVKATPQALEVIERLKDKHGPLARGELLPGDYDLKLGAIAGSPFYVDADMYERWGQPRFVIDVGEGEAGGFSLEGSEGVHFISRSPRHETPELR